MFNAELNGYYDSLQLSFEEETDKSNDRSQAISYAKIDGLNDRPQLKFYAGIDG